MRFFIHKFIIFCLFIFSSFSILAQSNAPLSGQGFSEINGKVLDSKTNSAVDFATVLLFSNAKQPVKAGQTDLDGNFSFKNVTNGTYKLEVSFLGYTKYSSDSIKISSNSLNLGTIKLNPSKSTVLQEVVIEGQRSTIQLGIDRKVFSVDQSLISEGGSATDLLANVPSVSVDMDGNVSLRGTDNVRVLIDGKPSAIGGGRIADILQSLPASAIESIELVTNPSSKYDPEGQSGIINIVLKKNKKIGLTGGVSSSIGSLNNYNASTNLSYRDQKVNLYGNYSYRNGNRVGGGFNNTQFLTNNGLVSNNSESNRKNLNNSFKLGADYYLNPKTTLGLSGNFSFRNNSSAEDLNYLISGFASENGSSFRETDRDGDGTGYDLSLDFSRDFKKKGENLVANVSFGQDKEKDFQSFNQKFYTPEGLTRDTTDSRNNYNNEFTSSYNLQIDYTLPLTEKQKFETGIRTTIRDNDESQLSELFSPINNAFNRDYNLSNSFLLNDQVYALYTNYQNQLTNSFGFQVGLRAEQAYLNTVYNVLGNTAEGVKGNLNYLRVYPSVFLTQKLKGDQQLQLSYTRRVNRPRGWQVNPFADVSDPNNTRVGNPNLLPEDINSFELSYIKYYKSLTFTSSAYLRQVNDVVQGIRLPQPDNNAATITQFFNLSRSRSSGLEFISKADLWKDFSLTSNLNLFYSQFEGNEEFNIKSNDGFNWNANLTGNLKLPRNISAQFNMMYMAPQVGSQGRRNEIFGMDAGLRMDVLKNKAGSISFNMRDIFNSRSWGQTTETEFFLQESERRMMGRMATLTFSYRFGKQDLGSRNKRNAKDQPRESGSEEEMF
ncbi:TonB-dependent receptor domain-containing protein [Daejeonella oryzae]|uniref:TonB-dependent receptor domain-containing protein n=1 Tax=Daejeonella oryzae TaxID=1122943 RepID=UPI0004004094|nr:TonB-dependent receptor [Daejeonella oryzae]